MMEEAKSNKVVLQNNHYMINKVLRHYIKLDFTGSKYTRKVK